MIKLILNPILNIFLFIAYVTAVGLMFWIIKDTWIVIASLIGVYLLLSILLSKK